VLANSAAGQSSHETKALLVALMYMRSLLAALLRCASC